MQNEKSVVLVVEDTAIIRMDALDLVSTAGYEALEACNADEAIVILESRDDIDLMFTDVQMPGSMDGLRLSHYVHEHWPPVKIILASGMENVHKDRLPAGSRFFSKPYSDTTITDEMARMLSNR